MRRSYGVRVRAAAHGDDASVIHASDIALVHAAHMVRANPSLREVRALEMDEIAWREHPLAPRQFDR